MSEAQTECDSCGKKIPDRVAAKSYCSEHCLKKDYIMQNYSGYTEMFIDPIALYDALSHLEERE